VESNELHTPDEWCTFFGVIVTDPDGWRGNMAKSWDEPITRKEFMQRCFMSSLKMSSPITEDF
jgi:hypothetical protein